MSRFSPAPPAAASCAAVLRRTQKRNVLRRTGEHRPGVCGQIVRHLFSHHFLSSAATVRCAGKRSAFAHVIPINMSADQRKRICFRSAKANRCTPVFSFQHRSMVCWYLPTVTERDFGPHSDSVYFWIWNAMVTFSWL